MKTRNKKNKQETFLKKRNKTKKKNNKKHLLSKKKEMIYKVNIRPKKRSTLKQNSFLKSLFSKNNINIIQNVINPNFLQVIDKIPNIPKDLKDENADTLNFTKSRITIKPFPSKKKSFHKLKEK
jgi:hypothetical protein